MADAGARVDVRLLGPIEVLVDGESLPLGGPKQRTVLAHLLVERNRVVAASRLIDVVWGESASDRSVATLQVYVSNLRRALEPLADALGVTSVIETRRPGYILTLPPGAVDLDRFDDELAAARAAAERGDHARAGHRFGRALDLWRGEPLGAIDDEWFPAGIRQQLSQRHVDAVAEHLDAQLALGRHAQVLADIEAHVAASPLDERFRGLLMLALYRTGRQADALSVYQQGRDLLLDELGLDPSPPLRELEAKILSHDPSLELPDPGGRPQSTGAHLDLATQLRSNVAPARACLVIGEERVELTRPVTTIGRRSDRHVVLDDTRVSRVHAEVRQVDGWFVLADAGSANGTVVNGSPVSEHPLQPGDVLVIGDTEVRFELL